MDSKIHIHKQIYKNVGRDWKIDYAVRCLFCKYEDMISFPEQMSKQYSCVIMHPCNPSSREAEIGRSLALAS